MPWFATVWTWHGRDSSIRLEERNGLGVDAAERDEDVAADEEHGDSLKLGGSIEVVIIMELELLQGYLESRAMVQSERSGTPVFGCYNRVGN